MHNADTQCTGEGREEVKGQRKFFMFTFSLTCLRIWIFISSVSKTELRVPCHHPQLNWLQLILPTTQNKIVEFSLMSLFNIWIHSVCWVYLPNISGIQPYLTSSFANTLIWTSIISPLGDSAFCFHYSSQNGSCKLQILSLCSEPCRVLHFTESKAQALTITAPRALGDLVSHDFRMLSYFSVYPSLGSRHIGCVFLEIDKQALALGLLNRPFAEQWERLCS